MSKPACMVMSLLSRLKKYFDLPNYQANHQSTDLPEISVHYFRPPLFPLFPIEML